MTNRKYVTGKAIYTLDMYLAGYPFEEFCARTKKKLMCDLVNLAELNEFTGQFTIEELDHYEVYKQVIKKQRADGQFVLKGDFTSYEVLEKLAKQHCKVVRLSGYVTEVGHKDIVVFEMVGEQNDRYCENNRRN